MKRVALISRGPSRAMYPGPEGYAEIIGVNTIVQDYACTWWSCIDPEYYGRIFGLPRLGSPRCWLRAGTAERCKQLGNLTAWDAWHKELSEGMTEDQLRPLPPMPPDMPRGGDGTPRWNKFGGTSALGLAWTLEATDVDCYGVDLAGIDGHGEKDLEIYRNDTRWQFERQIWFGLCEGFEAAGMKVRMARMMDWRMLVGEAPCHSS